MNKEEELVAKICKNIDSPLKAQIETMVKTIFALQKKLEENYDEYLTQPISLNVTVGTGETVSRANQFVIEYRNIYKDYCRSLKELKELIDEVSIEEELNALSSIKERFKLVK